MTSKALVVLSGGQDSTTCLYWAKERFDEVHAVTYAYGQRHERELVAATVVANMAGVDAHHIIEVGPILQGTSPLVDPTAELEQYADHGSLPGGLEKTFVPMRNQLFLTLAANHAYVRGITALVTGVCQEDNGGYPDCTRDFIDAFERVTEIGTFTGKDGAPGYLHVCTPLMDIDKAASVELALTLPGCYKALAWTHTSYDGAYPPTGNDHATLLRAKGFEEANVPDPLVWRSYNEHKLPLPASSNYGEEVLAKYEHLVDFL